MSDPISNSAAQATDRPKSINREPYEMPLPADLMRMTKHELQVRRAANRELDQEEAAELFATPPFFGSLADELRADLDMPDWRIDGLCRIGHNVLFAAQAKSGKTTTCANLLRSLADGTPFLGRLDVAKPAGRIGFLNYEMDRAQFINWLRDIGIEHPERISVLHLRGYSLPLVAQISQDYIVDWCIENEIEVLIADPWGRMMVGSGSENSNDDVRKVLEILGEIKRRADVTDLVLVAHMGHGAATGEAERARGASELMGWPDVLWNLTRAGENRFLSGYGRDIDFEEQELMYDTDTRQLVLSNSAGGRKETKTRRHVEEVVMIVSNHEGLSTTEIYDAMTTTSNREEKCAALKAAKRGMMVHEKVDGRKHLHYAGSGIDDAATAWAAGL